MTPQPDGPTPRPPLPERNANSIYTALLRVDTAEAALFDAEWRATMSRSTEAKDLAEVRALIERWWRRAVFVVNDPVGHREALDRARRFAAGEEVPTLTWEQILARLSA